MKTIFSCYRCGHPAWHTNNRPLAMKCLGGTVFERMKLSTITIQRMRNLFPTDEILQ